MDKMMQLGETKMDSYNQEKKNKKMEIKITKNGGIIGVVLLGGALVTTALVSAFALNRRLRKSLDNQQLPPPAAAATAPANSPKPDCLGSNNQADDDESSKALNFAPPNCPHPPLNNHPSSDYDCINDGTTETLMSTQTESILDEKSSDVNNGNETLTYVVEEISLLHVPNKPESSHLFDGSVKSVEEFSAAGADNPQLQVHMEHEELEVEKANDNLILLELQPSEEQFILPPATTVEVINYDEVVEVAQTDQTTVEENRPSDLKEEQGDTNGEIILAKHSTEVNIRIAVEDDQPTELTTNGDQESFSSNQNSVPKNTTEEEDGNPTPPIPDNPLSIPEAVHANNSPSKPLYVEVLKRMIMNEASIQTTHEKMTVNDAPIDTNKYEKIDIEKVQDNNGKADKKEDGSKADEKEDGEDAIKTIDEDMVGNEGNPLMQLMEDKSEEEEEEQEQVHDHEYIEEDNDEEEDTVDIREESSEGTRESSVESNAEAIWPAELLPDLSQDFKEFQTDNPSHNSVENDHGIKHEDNRKLTMSSTEKYMMELPLQYDPPPTLWNQRTWVAWSILVPLWCLCFWYFGSTFVNLFFSKHKFQN